MVLAVSQTKSDSCTSLQEKESHSKSWKLHLEPSPSQAGYTGMPNATSLYSLEPRTQQSKSSRLFSGGNYYKQNIHNVCKSISFESGLTPLIPKKRFQKHPARPWKVRSPSESGTRRTEAEPAKLQIVVRKSIQKLR